MSAIKNRLLRRFCNREYRHSYVESFLNSLISSQIRDLREREGFSQEELAKEIGTTQSGVSRLENPDYTSWRIETLRRLANAFDMALSVKFVSFGDVVEDIVRFGEDKLLRPSFREDPVFHPQSIADREDFEEGRVIDFPGPVKQVMQVTSEFSASEVTNA